jgi:hypothetical protein
MLNSTLQIKVKQRLNKLDSQDYDNIECWQIIEAFNKGMIQWCRRQLVGTNILKQGDEQSKRRVDDLQILLNKSTLDLSKFDGYYETTLDLPDNYMEFKRVHLSAFSECCTNKEMVVYLAEEANVPNLLRDYLKKPSFEWGETFMTLINNKLRIYTNNEFDLENIDLYFYRKPINIQIEGCVDPYTGLISTTNVECEFKDDITEVLIDEACAIIAGDIESIAQVQINAQSGEQNN